MKMRKYFLPWGDETITFTLPESRDVLGYLQPNAVTPAEDINESVAGSLNSPIGMLALQELLAHNKRTTIVIDDISRPEDLPK